MSSLEPKPGERWRSVLRDEEAVEIIRVTEVTVDYRDLRTQAPQAAMLDVFSVLYRPVTTKRSQERKAKS